MAIFSQTETSVDISKIEEIERYVGLNFPKDYSNHLLKFNGGQCTPNVFSFYEDGKIFKSCIDWFLAIYEGEYDNLKNYIDIYKIEEKRMPIHILPIAHDPGGNLVCISCGSNDFGKIYFWNHEQEVDYNKKGDNDYSNLFLIADTFNKFINELK